MQAHGFDGHTGREIEIDLCVPCQTIWFDGRESLQLTPGATLATFRLIGENVGRPSPQHRDIVRCPRCSAQLRRTRDLQRSTRFEYFRCPNNHGRLTTFFEFLKEKDFIKPLTTQQVTELRSSVQAINCSNCGAPIDLARRADCEHCRSPLSMLDLQQAEKLVAQLRDAEAGRTSKAVDLALPLALARARRETEAAFRGIPGHRPWDTDVSSLGLVGAGLAALMTLLKTEVD